jgi:GT2 family glycosyltransferase
VPAQGPVIAGAPRVAVIVLNYNGREHLPYCLPSILATDYPNLSILLVDNASLDGSVDLARGHGIEILQNNRNLGWSAGNNVGIRHALRAGAAYVVLANNDIRVHPRWVAEAVTVAESNPDAGVIGFDVHEPQRGDADQDAGYARACRAWSAVSIEHGAAVGGMAMCIRRSVFEELGLIDENFFAYGEENDLQLRAQRAGYQQLRINVPIWHHGSASFGRMPFRASLLQTQNNIQLLIKHGSAGHLATSAFEHVRRRLLGRHRPPTATAVELRLQPRSPLQAVVVLLLAAARILLQSPSILRRRAEDRRLIEAARARRLSALAAASGSAR